MLLNDLFANKLKIVGPINKTKLSFFFLFLPQHHHFFLLSSFFLSFSLSINKILFFSSLKKKKKTHTHTHTHTKHNYVFFFPSYFKIYYLKHSAKHIFLHYKYFKHEFLQHFLNNSFHIIFNNNTWTPLLNRL